MQYALINGVRNHPDAAYALQDVYSDYISDAVLAEEIGFSSTWYGEHHFRECQWTGSPMMLAAAVAARTERIRVGTSVVLLPFHDPIRVAEDAAIADILSNGRFDLGVGPGSQYEEFVTFGKDPAEMNQRSWEMVDWIQRAFTETSMFSHSGRFYDIPDMTFTTKPVQQPLPMWWGGMGPMNLKRAAERGMNLIAPFNAGYDAALEACGRNPADYQVSVMVPVCVADTADKAWEIAGPGIEYFVNFYQMRKNLQGEPAPAEARVTQEMLRSGNAGFWFAAVGTPDDVIGKLRPFVDGHLGRITQLALQMRQPGMSNADTHKSMRMFAHEVIPALS
ncbi:MAG TPA: LLM class flavin-dependent oxidoreductase [Ilumatobacteraceae bacterium]|nr:LLM class flavin-dependent oxidoreductase [Ilumatobacteraceae bacterium]